jgi:hypothetical protein
MLEETNAELVNVAINLFASMNENIHLHIANKKIKDVKFIAPVIDLVGNPEYRIVDTIETTQMAYSIIDELSI